MQKRHWLPAIAVSIAAMSPSTLLAQDSGTPGIDALVSSFLNENGMSVPASREVTTEAYDNFTGEPAQIDAGALRITDTLIADTTAPGSGRLFASTVLPHMPPSSPPPTPIEPMPLAELHTQLLDERPFEGAHDYAFDPMTPPPTGPADLAGTILGDAPLEDFFAPVFGGDLAAAAEQAEWWRATLFDELRPPGALADDLFGPGGPLGCPGPGAFPSGDATIVCGDPTGGTNVWRQGFTLVGVGTAGDPRSVGRAETELPVGVVDPNAPIYQGQFPNDFFNGTNRNYAVQIYPDRTQLSNFVFDGQSWQAQPTDTVAIVSDAGVVYAIPRTEVMPVGYRANTFTTDARQPGGVASHSFPLPTEPAAPWDPAPFTSMPSTPFTLDELRELLIPTTTTIAPTTTVAAASTTVASTTAPAPAAVGSTGQGDTGTEDIGDDDSGGSSAPWWIVLAVVVAALGAGAWLLARRNGDPCDEFRSAYGTAQDACDRARNEAAAARGAADAARRANGEAEADLAALVESWPPTGWTGDGSDSWVEESGRPETRIDRFDVHVGREWRRHQMDRWRNGEISAEEAGQLGNEPPSDEFTEDMNDLDDLMQEQRSELEQQVADTAATARDAARKADEAEAAATKACAAAEAARRALDECEARPHAPAPEQPAGGLIGVSPADSTGGSSGGATGGGTTGGGTTGGGTNPPPTAPGTVSAGDGPPGGGTAPRPGGTCKPDDPAPPPEILARFSRRITADYDVRVTRVGIRRGGEAEALSTKLGATIPYLEAAAAAASGAGAIYKVGAGQAGRAAVDVAGAATGVPTSPVDVALGVVTLTAKIGKLVSDKTGQWLNEHHELYNIHTREYVVSVDAVWKNEFRCVDGRWRATKVFEYSVGKLERGRVNDEEVTHQELRRKVIRRNSAMAGWVRSGAEAFGRFAAGPP